ncbi:hypothetical protein Egran_02934 [Elaphomyces granulatus]|uniref:WSC domain-containing protein n=1 Tax=Elaphomyces granulatus TaxID=519963 RepID=A0A232LYR0_9EURO|nr:hypothetical protein Egran_02934 [Elaphomyces granulatus]
MAWPWVFALSGLLAILQNPAPAVALQIAYCSSQNTGSSSSANTSLYQSNGLCRQTCANYAFAILQGKSCWCSNFAPGDTASVSGCNSPCPGYPSDLCGNAPASLYGYIALGPSPSGTVAASTATSTSSTSQETTSSSSSSSSSSTSNTVMTTQPVISVQTVSGQPVTVTIQNPTPTNTSASSVGHSPSGSSLSRGSIAGIVIGSLAGAGVLVGLLIGLCIYVRRRRSGASGIPDSRYDPSLQNTLLDGARQSKGSQMSTLRNIFDDPGPSQTGKSPTDLTFTDTRMKKDGALYPNGSRQSAVSIQDNQDYNRPVLRLTNPD